MHKIIFAALALATTTHVLAQQTQSLNRADVKAETRALEKAGKLTPAGDGAYSGPEKNFTTTKTRAERKAETRLAARNLELQPAGEAGEERLDNALRAQPTTRSRPERKEETRVAQRERQLVPAGEGPDSPKR